MTSSTAQHSSNAGALTPRSRTRVGRIAAATIALGAGAALALTGCGAGQVTQTGSKEAAVTGSFVDVGDIAIRNAHIAFEDAEAYPLETSATATLVFTVVNNNAVTPDVLTSIESFDAQVSFPDDELTVPAGGVLRVGTAVLELEPDEDRPTVELSNLSSNVRPGLTVPITFTFEETGEIVLNVPVEPGAASTRTYVPRPYGSH
ncbi:hypothetical protein IEU95_00500 [Hoyosella rhizosphaerae]|uniref:Lipoprotein LpqE n=1 Tax=Hoyosella rhizosphaerae TaxID=1755582 RepID=A0A916UKU6_9ACTN|nr:hypothetical protein [Hoyosella rhizosphaerae]MBN4925299.1 hypothetical protein [Hoyosella rhizosphaerae]GGC76393.1 putative lipoprotein LpqE [Hoyosella rhizosphaerae]